MVGLNVFVLLILNFACYDIVTVYTDVIGKSQCLLRVPNQLHVKLCL